DRSLPLDQRTWVLNNLNGITLAPSLANAQRFLALGADPGERELRDSALSSLRRLLTNAGTWNSALPALREALGETVASEIARDPTSKLVELVASVAPDDAPQTLLALVRKLGANADRELIIAIANCVSSAPSADSAAAFEAWMQIARATPNSWKATGGVDV